MSDIFFNVFKLSKSKFKELLKESFNLSYEWWADHLKNGNIFKEKINISREEVLKIYNKTKRKDLYFIFIQRKNIFKGDYLEVGFCTIGQKNKDIFTWIHIDIKYKDMLINKYKLNII